MHLFAKQEHQNRDFKKMRAQMPLVITFRALKQNAIVNRWVQHLCLYCDFNRFHLAQKLKRGMNHLFSDLQLRETCFRRWKEFVQIGQALEALDVALLVSKLRCMFQNWKMETWPERFGKESTKTRLMRTVTGAISSHFQDTNQSFRSPAKNQSRDPNDNEEIMSQFSFGSQTSFSRKGWLNFALLSG